MNLFEGKIASLRLSWRAIVHLFEEETNFRMEVGVGAALIALALVAGLSSVEFILLFLIIGAVFVVEIINTAIEELCDHISPEYHERIGKIKDLSAAACSITSIVAILVALFLFEPHLIPYIMHP